jgi:DnaJ-class molecular chaperone
VLKVELGDVQGGIVRVPGKGFPYVGEDTMRGDLLINFEVQFPGKLTQAQRDVINRVFADE